MATIAMGIFAKFLESKLDKNVTSEDYVELDKVKQYSLKNVETF